MAKNVEGNPIKKPFGKNEIILFVCSICLTFLIGEISSRIWLRYFATKDQYRRYILYTEIPREEWCYAPHHYLIYYPTPNYRHGRLSHNSMGYRADEFTVQKPKGVYRIALLGESSTYDTAINDNAKTFAARLERILEEKYNYKNIEVINGGVGGYNSWESLINFEFRILDLNPDLVIVYCGTNDVHTRLVVPEYYHGDNSGRRESWTLPYVPFWQKSCLLRIITRGIGLNHQIDIDTASTARTARYIFNNSSKDSDKIIDILKRNPPIYFERNLNNIIAIAKEHNIEIVLSTWAHSPYFDDYASTKHYEYGFKENNDVIKKVAEHQHVPLFDFDKIMSKDKKYWADGRHSNAMGAQKKAEMFAEFIDQQKLIKR